MRSYLLRLSLLMLLLTALSCDNDDESSPKEIKPKYPIKLSFKKEGNSTLEHWKGGVLINSSLDDYVNSFKGSKCLDSFKEQSDNFCKNAEITFLNEEELVLKYAEEIKLDYEFVNDTLKVTLNNETRDLGVGNKTEIKIYGTLSKIKTATYEHCGGNEFFKQNFDGQFFLNINENQNLLINSPNEMKQEDEVVFYIKEYILK